MLRLAPRLRSFLCESQVAAPLFAACVAGAPAVCETQRSSDAHCSCGESRESRHYTAARLFSARRRSSPGTAEEQIAFEQACGLPHSDEEDIPPEQFDRGEVPEIVWPATKKQRIFAARVKNALTAVCQDNHDFHSSLLMRFGFAVEEVARGLLLLHLPIVPAPLPAQNGAALGQVRMAPDNLTAYVLWDALPGPMAETAAELRRLAPKLRRAVGARLHARNVPRLEFRHDSPSAVEAEVEATFQRLAAEREEEQAAREARARVGMGGKAPGAGRS